MPPPPSIEKAKTVVINKGFIENLNLKNIES